VYVWLLRVMCVCVLLCVMCVCMCVARIECVCICVVSMDVYCVCVCVCVCAYVCMDIWMRESVFVDRPTNYNKIQLDLNTSLPISTRKMDVIPLKI